MMCRRDRPRSLMSSPTMPLDLVATIISSRRPRRARPRICSAGSRSAAAGAPGRSKTGMLPYTSAVSTKLMPRSIAAPTSRSASCAEGATPKVAVPRQIWDTFTPVDPRTEYFIRELPCLLGGMWNDTDQLNDEHLFTIMNYKRVIMFRQQGRQNGSVDDECPPHHPQSRALPHRGSPARADHRRRDR